MVRHNPIKRIAQLVRKSEQLPVESISAKRFWDEKRARQAVSHSRVASGEVPQAALFAFSAEQLCGAKFKWPKDGFSAAEDEERSRDRGEPSRGDNE